jgi:Ca-activated chloride channel homolog
MRPSASTAACAMLLAMALSAADAPSAHLRVDSFVVLISASVTDRSDQLVLGLGKENFRVFEDKQEQSIVHFAMEDTPLSLGLVFDSSASMQPRVRDARRAVAELLRAINPEDEMFLVEFERRPRLVVDFTHDAAAVQSQLFAATPRGSTALLDAVVLAIQQMRKGHNPRKALVLVSDGWDNNSRYSPSEVLRTVREADVRIYAIAIGDSGGRRLAPAYLPFGPDLMAELADQTGGKFIELTNAGELPDVTAQLGREMRSQYVLGYKPSNERRDGRYRRVDLKVTPPAGVRKLHVAWRRGYFAPAE